MRRKPGTRVGRFVTMFNLAACGCLPAIPAAARDEVVPDASRQEPALLELTGDLGVHDPSIIKEHDTYYIFATGGGRRGGGVIPVMTSTDLHTWTRAGHVFKQLPGWATNAVPRARGAWAPHISFFHGKYHLYYSVSTFGRNVSAIGLAVSKTLDPDSPDYAWEDRGMVVQSREKVDDWNAIDPHLAIEDKHNIWLAWGSFWSGLKMRRVDPETGLLAAEDPELLSLASRPRAAGHVTPPVVGALEAPTLIERDGYWYLFASYDMCCRGTNSTYKVRVGRSQLVTGPYLDREGIPMMEGGGMLVVEAATTNWTGAGHQDVLREGDRDYLVFHAYDGQRGRPRLQISTIAWEDGWPRVAKMP